ncbi:TIGR02444 family protein [Aequoribacter sp.]|uniref:TIGR02444 family protein n=1 Tax=Aequoribacter sp. TaxID=2847771 RepID=UPI003C60CB83
MLQEHSLWQFSLKVYAYEPLQSLLLEAQDRLGVDVNFALAALWLAEHGMVLSEARAANLLQRTAELREQGIEPVRALRRRWKGIGVLQEPRQALQALELSLEKQVQAILYDAFASDNLVGDITQHAMPVDLRVLIEQNLAALPVSDQTAWAALASRIAAQYRATAGQR